MANTGPYHIPSSEKLNPSVEFLNQAWDVSGRVTFKGKDYYYLSNTMDDSRKLVEVGLLGDVGEVDELPFKHISQVLNYFLAKVNFEQSFHLVFESEDSLDVIEVSGYDHTYDLLYLVNESDPISINDLQAKFVKGSDLDDLYLLRHFMRLSQAHPEYSDMSVIDFMYGLDSHTRAEYMIRERILAGMSLQKTVWIPPWSFAEILTGEESGYAYHLSACDNSEYRGRPKDQRNLDAYPGIHPPQDILMILPNKRHVDLDRTGDLLILMDGMSSSAAYVSFMIDFCGKLERRDYNLKDILSRVPNSLLENYRSMSALQGAYNKNDRMRGISTFVSAFIDSEEDNNGERELVLEAVGDSVGVVFNPEGKIVAFAGGDFANLSSMRKGIGARKVIDDIRRNMEYASSLPSYLCVNQPYPETMTNRAKIASGYVVLLFSDGLVAKHCWTDFERHKFNYDFDPSAYIRDLALPVDMFADEYKEAVGYFDTFAEYGEADYAMDGLLTAPILKRVRELIQAGGDIEGNLKELLRFGEKNSADDSSMILRVF